MNNIIYRGDYIPLVILVVGGGGGTTNQGTVPSTPCAHCSVFRGKITNLVFLFNELISERCVENFQCLIVQFILNEGFVLVSAQSYHWHRMT